MKIFFIKFSIIVLLAEIFYSTLFAQSCDTLYIRRNEEGRIEFAKFAIDPNSNRKMAQGATFLKNILQIEPGYQFILKSDITDNLGIQHKKFRLCNSQGTPIDFFEYVLHGIGGEIIIMNGDYQSWYRNIAPKFQSKKTLIKPLGFEDKEIEKIYNASVLCTAETKYSGIQNIMCDYVYDSGFKYKLQETRNTISGNIKIFTKNWANNHESDITNNNTNWTSISWYPPKFFNDHQQALDVHWGTERTIDYWSTVHATHLLDSLEGKITSLVHWCDDNVCGAKWVPDKIMLFGDGGTDNYHGVTYDAFTSLDLVAHEFGHGITQFSANLIPYLYENSYDIEASALNEGFSDIWGACVKYWAAPEKEIWKIGDEIIASSGYDCIRNLQDPKSSLAVDCGFSTYGGLNWDPNNIHPYWHSTVLSHWFYLLSEGGSGTNDHGTSYKVIGITIDKAQHIAYRTLAYYLYPTADYKAARDASIQAAIDLFGAKSHEEMSVRCAWHAVGLGLDSMILTNSVWADNQQLNTSVIVLPGATLTITGAVSCTSKGSISVLSGGKLIINGGTLTNAEPKKLWQGITVLGGLSNQIAVKVINGGKIENASCAISVNGYSGVYAEDAHFVNNTIGVFFTQNGSGKFIRTNFELNNKYFGECGTGSFGNKSDFITHIRAYNGSSSTVEGCTFSSTAPFNSTRNRGIDIINADLTIKEHCPSTCGYICQGCFCTESCMDKTSFIGFNKAVSAINTGTTPTVKVRFSNFENNLYGIYISGINNHEFIKNNFELTLDGSYGAYIRNSTGYKIEENSFYDAPLPAPNKITVGLTISNSGVAENEVYKNEFFNLAYAQVFLNRNSSQLDSLSTPHDSIHIHRNLITGLQALCNNFNYSKERDIYVSNVSVSFMMKNLSIRKEQGSLLVPAGNKFDKVPYINIDNSKSQHPVDYYCPFKTISNQIPHQVSNNVKVLSASNQNSCPSKIGIIGGGGTKKGTDDFSPYLAQYDEWNEQYEYWLARAGEVCGLGYEVRGEGYRVSGEDEECAMIWGMVSHYSALKDNYFNAIIVAAMNDVSGDFFEIPRSARNDGEHSPSKFEGVPEGWGSLYENLRFLFSYRGQYGDYLSIAETFLAENNYREALATLTQLHEKFKLTEEQVSEITALRIYTHWLQQLEEQGNSIYTLSENEIEYLVNYAETHSGRGVIFAKNILCGLYGVCLEEGDVDFLEIPRSARNDEGKSAQSVSSEFKINALENIQIFPNPTTGELQIQSSKFKVQNVEIYDVYGRNLTPQTPYPTPLTTINISHLHSGIYFVKITTDVGVVVKKVVKQ